LVFLLKKLCAFLCLRRPPVLHCVAGFCTALSELCRLRFYQGFEYGFGRVTVYEVKIGVLGIPFGHLAQVYAVGVSDEPTRAMMSLRTIPGPSDGNWSTSPTSINPALSGNALSKRFINGTSIMLVSSAYVELHISRFMLSDQ
jgi:hypothetical protein